MPSNYLLKCGLRVGVLAAVACVPWAAWAADSVKGLSPADPDRETIDFFSAVEKGQISAQLIPRDAWQCRLIVRNKTDKPLNVRLPDVLAGVPVAAQFLPPGNNANGNRNQPGGNNASQALGLSTPMQNNFGGPMNNRGNQGLLFNIAPEATGQLKMASLCLEHGKPTPRPNRPYEIQPIQDVAGKAEVQEVVRMLGQGELSQRAAQAAVWHLNNGMSWEKLQAEKTSKLVLIPQPMFSARDLADAKKAVEQAAQRCKPSPSASPTQSAQR